MDKLTADALLRPGRVALSANIRQPDCTQLELYARRFFDEPPADADVANFVSAVRQICPPDQHHELSWAEIKSLLGQNKSLAQTDFAAIKAFAEVLNR